MRRAMKKNNWNHDRCRRVYGVGMNVNDESDWSRDDAVCMARLRSGYSLELGEYRARIGLTDRDGCRRCGEETETLEHVWNCMSGYACRMMLGLSDLSDLCRKPREALKYWRWWRRVRPPEE